MSARVAGDWCPVHADAGVDTINAWACPDDCEHFAEELQRRIDDIRINGNYTSVFTDDAGLTWRQHYRKHLPVGEPTLWKRMTALADVTEEEK